MPVLTRLRAPLTKYAALHSDAEHRIARIRRLALPPRPAPPIDPMPLRRQTQLPIPLSPIPPIRAFAVLRKHPQRKLQHPPPHRLRPIRIRAHPHPLRCRHSARRRIPAHPLYLHQTSPAGPNRIHIRILAQLRYVSPRLIDSVKNRRPLRHLNLPPVHANEKCPAHTAIALSLIPFGCLNPNPADNALAQPAPLPYHKAIISQNTSPLN